MQHNHSVTDVPTPFVSIASGGNGPATGCQLRPLAPRVPLSLALACRDRRGRHFQDMVPLQGPMVYCHGLGAKDVGRHGRAIRQISIGRHAGMCGMQGINEKHLSSGVRGTNSPPDVTNAPKKTTYAQNMSTKRHKRNGKTPFAAAATLAAPCSSNGPAVCHLMVARHDGNPVHCLLP